MWKHNWWLSIKLSSLLTEQNDHKQTKIVLLVCRSLKGRVSQFQMGGMGMGMGLAVRRSFPQSQLSICVVLVLLKLIIVFFQVPRPPGPRRYSRYPDVSILKSPAPPAWPSLSMMSSSLRVTCVTVIFWSPQWSFVNTHSLQVRLLDNHLGRQLEPQHCSPRNHVNSRFLNIH